MLDNKQVNSGGDFEKTPPSYLHPSNLTNPDPLPMAIFRHSPAKQPH